MNEQEKRTAYIELKFGPNWDYVVMGYSVVTCFLSSAIKDGVNTELIAIAVIELLSNAVKYSETKDVTLQINVTPSQVDIKTFNLASEENIEYLKKEIEDITQGTPLEAYIRKCRQIEREPKAKHSLGFARIRYESNGKISHKIIDKEVEVFVTCAILRGEDTR